MNNLTSVNFIENDKALNWEEKYVYGFYKPTPSKGLILSLNNKVILNSGRFLAPSASLLRHSLMLSYRLSHLYKTFNG